MSISFVASRPLCRAILAIQMPGSSAFRTVLCDLHEEPAMETTARLLLMHYGTPEAIHALLDGGDIADLEQSPESGWTVYHGRDLGKRARESGAITCFNYPDLACYFGETRARYLFIYSDGGWCLRERDCPLDPRLSLLEPIRIRPLAGRPAALFAGKDGLR